MTLRSGEASLLCSRGRHVAGHPAFCVGGCVLVPEDSGLVRAVLPYKRHTRLWENPKPALVEDGWLLDGHHRVAYACSRGLSHVWVRQVSGRLEEFQERWDAIRERLTGERGPASTGSHLA